MNMEYMEGCLQKKLEKDKKKMNEKFILITLIYAIVMGCAQIVLSKASIEIGDNLKENTLFFSIIKSYWLIIGTLIYIFATLFWLWILYNLDIRFAYPIASTSVIVASLIQSYLSKSFPGKEFWIGLSLICVGLSIVINSKIN